jgi:hypothetical protein
MPGIVFAAVAYGAAVRRQNAVAFWDSGVTSEETLPGEKNDVPRILNALYSDHPWTTAFLGGMRLPGLCKVLNGLTEIGIDMKKPEGKDGSTITVKGYKPGKFEIACTVWSSDQWDVLQNIISVVWREKKKKAKLATLAIDVSHPALVLLGVSSCVIEGITFPQPGEFDGSMMVGFKCVENVAPGKKSATKTATGPGVAKELQTESRIEEANRAINATPPKPSTQKSHTGPRGQHAPPANGPN